MSWVDTRTHVEACIKSITHIKAAPQTSNIWRKNHRKWLFSSSCLSLYCNQHPRCWSVFTIQKAHWNKVTVDSEIQTTVEKRQNGKCHPLTWCLFAKHLWRNAEAIKKHAVFSPPHPSQGVSVRYTSSSTSHPSTFSFSWTHESHPHQFASGNGRRAL